MKIASGSLKSALNIIEEQNKKIDNLEKVSEVRGVIDTMIEKGIVDENSAQEKVAELLQKDKKQIEIVKEAVNLSGSSSNNIFFDNDNSPADLSGEKEMFGGVI
jgi:ribosomal protein S20